MSQFWLDFTRSSEVILAELEGTGSPTVVTHLGRRTVYFPAANAVREWKPAGVVRDCEILATLITTSAPFSSSYGGGAAARFDQSGNGYTAGFQASNVTTALIRWDAFEPTALDSFTVDTFDERWYKFRMRLVGDLLSWKVWLDTVKEPKDWMASVTNSAYPVGFIGFRNRSRPANQSEFWCAQFSVGTNGDPAPEVELQNTLWVPSLFEASMLAALTTGGGGTTITAEPASLSHATALAASAVSLEHLLAPAALTHASALSESAVQLGTQVVPAALSHASAIAVAEVQTGLLIAPESLAHATTLSDGALALVYSVAPNALTHTTGLGDGAVFSGVSVEPAAITYSTSLGAGAVQFVHEVQPASLSHLTSLGASAINVGYEIAPANLTFGTLLAPVLVSVSGSGTGASAAEIAQAVWGDPRALTVGKFLALK